MTIEEYRWSKKGTVSFVKVQGKRQKRINLIAVQTCDGILAPFTFEESCDTALFNDYIEKILCPLLKPNQVVIMDNATFHKSKKIKEFIEEKQCQLIFLPPYSPDCNPIEHYWGVLKKHIKKIRKNIQDVATCVELALKSTQSFGQSMVG